MEEKIKNNYDIELLQDAMVIEISKSGEQHLSEANELAIDSPETQGKGSDILASISTDIKEIESIRKKYTDPLEKAKKMSVSILSREVRRAAASDDIIYALNLLKICVQKDPGNEELIELFMDIKEKK